jgi:hypothetical protein
MLHAHGGHERWNATDGFSAYVSISGFLIPPLPYLPQMPNQLQSLCSPQHRMRPHATELAIEGDTHRPHLRILGATDAAFYGLYTPQCSELRTLAQDLPVARSSPGDQPSSPGSGSGPADLISLLGAFLWNAVVGPFVLTREGHTSEKGGPNNRECLDILLPDHIDPISPRRTLTIDKAGMILQSNYNLRLIQSRRVIETMKAYWNFDGIRISTLRRIALAGAATCPGPLPLVDIEIFDVRFH